MAASEAHERAVEIIYNEVAWDVLDGSTTPWGGLWFTVEIGNIEKWRNGTIHSQFEIDMPDAPPGPSEEPEHMYIELDPESGKARVRLQTILIPHWDDARWTTTSSRPGETPYQPPPGQEATPKKGNDREAFIYTSTASIKGEGKAENAIKRAIHATLLKWAAAPFASGEKMMVPHEARMESSQDFARQMFDVDTAFYGLDV